MWYKSRFRRKKLAEELFGTLSTQTRSWVSQTLAKPTLITAEKNSKTLEKPTKTNNLGYSHTFFGWTSKQEIIGVSLSHIMLLLHSIQFKKGSRQ